MARFRIRRNTDKAHIDNSGTFKLIPAISYIFTLAPTQTSISTQAPALTPTPISAPDLLEKYIDKDL